MLRIGAVLLLGALLAAAPGGAIRVLGDLDPTVAAWLTDRGVEVQSQRVSAPAIEAGDPDVLIVTSEAEISPQALRAYVEGGRAAIVSNQFRPTYFSPLSIQRGDIQLVNVRANAADPAVFGFQSLVSGTNYPVRVYWPASDSPDTLYSLQPLEGSFDSVRTYGVNTVIAGMAMKKGYLLVLPSASLERSDGYYATNDPVNIKSQNQPFLLEAIQHAFQRSSRASPSPTPAVVPTPAPTPAPTATPTAIPSTAPPSTATPTPAPATPPPAPSRLPLLAGGVIVAILVVAVLVVVRMRKRPPPPAEAPGVGLGPEEIPPEPPAPESPEVPPPPEAPPSSPT